MICIEAIIKNAQEDGLFDDLKGKGKPQDLRRNPYEQSEDSMAFSMLKDSGFVPPIVNRLREIESMRKQLKNLTDPDKIQILRNKIAIADTMIRETISHQK